MGRSINERAADAIKRSFKQMDLPSDVAQLVIYAMATEFGNERSYDPETHVCVSRETAIALLMNVRGIDDANFAAAELRVALEVGE